MQKIKINNFFKFKVFNLISLILSLIIIGSIIYVAFWEFNIFKKEIQVAPDVLEIQKEINSLKNLNFNQFARELSSKLPSPQVLSEPTLSSDSIGKNNWFD
ncbi:MAG: hypothetical protein NZ866_01940 [Patescibacteria group bacterium]|nr:hypothetical protein [Patescibacteria group bacterium]